MVQALVKTNPQIAPPKCLEYLSEIESYKFLPSRVWHGGYPALSKRPIPPRFAADILQTRTVDTIHGAIGRANSGDRTHRLNRLESIPGVC